MDRGRSVRSGPFIVRTMMGFLAGIENSTSGKIRIKKFGPRAIAVVQDGPSFVASLEAIGVPVFLLSLC